MFFIDRQGDSTLESRDAEPRKEKEDFISLNQQEGGGRGGKRGKAKGKKVGRKKFVKASTAEKDQDSVLQDYIDNCDPMEALMPTTLLASANMEDDWNDTLALEKLKMLDKTADRDYDDVDQEQEQEVQDENELAPEQGYYEALTRLHEDDVEEDDDSWQDTDEQVSSGSGDEIVLDDQLDDEDLDDDLSVLEGDSEGEEMMMEGDEFDFKKETKAMQNDDTYSSNDDISFLSSDAESDSDSNDDDDRATSSSQKKMQKKGSNSKKLDAQLAYMMEFADEEAERQARLDNDMNTDSSSDNDNWKSASAKRKQNKRAKKAKRAEKARRASENQESAGNLTQILKSSGRSTGKEMTAYLNTINVQIHNWVVGEVREEYEDNLFLPPMPQGVRMPIIQLCKLYNVKPKVQGSGKRKRLVLFRNKHTTSPESWTSFVANVLGGSKKLKGNIVHGPRTSKKETSSKKKGTDASNSAVVVGSKVGAGAAKIAQDNVGHKMMRLMGWTPGTALGREVEEGKGGSGIVEPIGVVVRGKRTGLGA